MSHEFLTAENIPDYVAAHAELTAVLDPAAITDVREVGDGNLNLVFIVADAHGGSLVLKQALPYVRMVGPEWPMTPDRAAREAESLARHGELCPDLVPQMHLFDPERFIIAMEDLSDHRVWRGALIEGLRHDGAAAEMGRYVGDVAFGTSVLSVSPDLHRQQAARALNTELCAITEDLVFTEPYVDAGRNSVLPGNAADAAALAADPVVLREMAHAKWIFTTRAEALVHGDLHTGSVMVRAAHGADGPVDSAKAFDSEFAFMGPVAFDLGALWANYVLAAARAVALGDDDLARWTLALPGQTWEAFEHRLLELWPGRREPRLMTDDFAHQLLAQWRSETWLFSAAKMARRIVGLAKVADVETLEPELREGAARGVLALARRCVRDRHVDASPAAYAATALEVLTEHTTR